MEVIFTPRALEDREYWKRTGNKRVMKRITDLLEDIKKHPFTGIGKPEPLRNMNGYWSRRINDEHRLVYKLTGTNDPANGDSRELFIVQCVTHYE